jgi:uncharacterized protein DUF29
MSDYDTDIVLWSEHQAGLLSRRAKGELVNDAELDWPNIAEEIESVGREQRHAVESLLMRALVHLLKIKAWPQSDDVSHWQAESRLFRADARRRYVPSMRQWMDLTSIYRQALRGLPDAIDGEAPLPVPDVCPVTLDELLGDN